MQSKVHPTYKTQHRVANWPAYNQALVRRGDVTVWLSSEAIAAWTARRSGRRGGQGIVAQSRDQVLVPEPLHIHASNHRVHLVQGVVLVLVVASRELG